MSISSDLSEAADMCGPEKMKITEAELEEALDSRSDKPIYRILKEARIGIAGLGGLGSNIASALVRNGVGHLVIADFDVVELSNINRQVYTPAHVGMEKAPALRRILSEINPFCEIEEHVTRVTEENVQVLFGRCDIVIEAFDIPEQKAMLVNAVLEKIPSAIVISGSGMAGYGNANAIRTRIVNRRLTICGDGTTAVADGVGLNASRVIICAGHMASRAIELILNKESTTKE